MTKFFVGIDVGSSSIKALGFSNKKRIFIKKNYVGNKPKDYLKLVEDVIDEMILKTNNNISSIAFSSQTGTYIIDDEYIIHWSENKGSEELSLIKASVTKKEFIDEIQMDHPFLISYPLVRLLFIKKNYSNVKKVCQLKDYLIYNLTHNYVSDYYTWRGIYNFNKKSYSKKLIKKFNLLYKLPTMVSPDFVAGKYKGIDIVVGLNDFYSALIGMGAIKDKSYFDITGTSEHIGYILRNLDEKNISSPFLNNFVSYGVTSSCGPSINFINSLIPNTNATLRSLKNNPPIFLPYLNGERAPIYDVNARGMFFNITTNTKKEDVIYSVYEGIAFSLFDILRIDNIKNLIVCGGASDIKLLNEIKANLFKANLLIPKETESSAFGAYLLAKYKLNIELILKEISYKKITFKIDNEIHKLLLKRYLLFKKIYESNKDNFKDLKEALS